MRLLKFWPGLDPTIDFSSTMARTPTAHRDNDVPALVAPEVARHGPFADLQPLGRHASIDEHLDEHLDEQELQRVKVPATGDFRTQPRVDHTEFAGSRSLGATYVPVGADCGFDALAVVGDVVRHPLWSMS